MSNLSDLIPAGGGQNNTDFVADGAIASGKPVILTAAGKAAEIDETTVASDMPLGSDTEYESRNVEYQDLQADPHNSDRWIACWMDDDGGTKDVNVKIFTLSGTTWTSSALIIADAGGTGNRVPCICWEKSQVDQLLLVYNDSSNSYGAAKVGLISGSAGSESITWGTEHVFNSQIRYGSSTEWPQVRSLGSYKYFTYYIGATGYPNSSYGIVLDVSAWTVTSGTETALVTDVNSLAHNATVVPTDSTKIIYGFREDTSEKLALIQLSISGTTITVGSETLTSDLISDNGLTIIPVNATKIVVMTGTNGTNYPSYVIATNSSGSFSTGTLTTFESSTAITIQADNNLETSSNLISYYANQTGTRYPRGRAGTINGAISSITFSAEEQLSTTAGYNWSAVAQQSDAAGTCAFIYETTSSTGNLLLGETGSTSSTLTATNLLGIAAGAILDTATGTINTWGSRNEVQSGLTIASDYYAQNDGTITTSDGGQLLGKALSATQINIKDYTG